MYSLVASFQSRLDDDEISFFTANGAVSRVTAAREDSQQLAASPTLVVAAPEE